MCPLIAEIIVAAKPSAYALMPQGVALSDLADERAVSRPRSALR
jgi:hypothetical protein